MPTASKNSAISCPSGAPPEIGVRRRPPSRSRIFVEDEPVGEARLQLQRASDGLARLLPLADLSPDPERPVGQSALHARRLVEGRDDRGVNLLVDAGHARQHRRTHGQQGVRRLQRVGQEGDRVADVRAGQVHQPPEVVGEREVQEHQVVVVHVARQVVDHRHHRVVVAMPHHAALGRACRARGVLEREEIVLVDGSDRLGERRRVLLAEARALGFELGEIGHGQQVPKARQRGSVLFDACRQVGIRTEHADRLGVVEDVRGVVGRAVRVDGRHDGSDLRQREVEQRPLERRAGEDRERLALPDAPREQAVGQVLDALGRLGPADLVPVIAVLDEIRGAVAVARDRVLPESCDRSLRSHGVESTRRTCRNGESRAE